MIGSYYNLDNSYQHIKKWRHMCKNELKKCTFKVEHCSLDFRTQARHCTFIWLIEWHDIHATETQLLKQRTRRRKMVKSNWRHNDSYSNLKKRNWLQYFIDLKTHKFYLHGWQNLIRKLNYLNRKEKSKSWKKKVSRTKTKYTCHSVMEKIESHRAFNCKCFFHELFFCFC